MGKFVDRTGVRYGNLVALNRVGTAANGKRMAWECLCDCGTTIVVTGHGLSSGDTRSCGCLKRETIGSLNRTHAMSKTPTYRSWQAMKERCYNTQNCHYPAYGGRGITVSLEWLESFDAFFRDMGERPAGMTIDRVNNDLGYFKENCRWATTQTQANNRRTNVFWEGESLSIKQLAEKVGVPRTSLNKLIRKGMPIHDAVAHAVKTRKT